VEEIHWTDGSGNPVSGGLYLPPDYIADKKYPLVIQTHGFGPHTFVIDGPHMTASAAQPLACKGIVVLQMNDIFYDSLNTPQEAERAMSAYENAIEYLDQTGIIDRSRVGLVGFSRTSLYVKYTLTHSSQHFAAAIVADGFDAGYLQYMISNNASNLTSEVDSVIGAAPFGTGLSLWLKRSPGFLLHKVQTPLQIQALSPGSLPGEWEWFAGLKRLEKPVDFVYLPTGTHVLVKPWDRMVSQQGVVDWFSFWLKGEEDPDPAKAEQYARWRELRKMQEENEAKARAAPVN
jgi:dipeptidyl aminopeptidase/acylaminoacyl peptidase